MVLVAPAIGGRLFLSASQELSGPFSLAGAADGLPRKRSWIQRSVAVGPSPRARSVPRAPAPQGQRRRDGRRPVPDSEQRSVSVSQRPLAGAGRGARQEGAADDRELGGARL